MGEYEDSGVEGGWRERGIEKEREYSRCFVVMQVLSSPVCALFSFWCLGGLPSLYLSCTVMVPSFPATVSCLEGLPSPPCLVVYSIGCQVPHVDLF